MPLKDKIKTEKSQECRKKYYGRVLTSLDFLQNEF